jgi:hypothetical protein
MTAAKFIKIALFTLMFVLTSPGAFATQTALSEGFLVKGGYGKVIEPNAPQNQGSKWRFEFTDEYSNEEDTIQPGAEFPLLKSSALEQITKEQKGEKPQREYRIWAMTTKFKGSSFLYPVYFLPVRERTEKTEPEPQTPDKPEEANETAQPEPPNEPDTADDTESSQEKTEMNEPEDAVKVPDEILDRLKNKRTYTPEPVESETEKEEDKQQEQPDSEEPEKKPEPEPQSRQQFEVLTSRIGYINKNENGWYIFEVEGYGKKVSKETYYLQPCQALEKAIGDQKEALNQPRFRIAGITDTFDGKKYLLLHRAVLKYSYGNFGR